MFQFFMHLFIYLNKKKRQVNKDDVDFVINKYGSKRISDSTNTIINDLEKVNNGSNCLNLTHYESTSCEEYDLVQNLFHNLIREWKREKETFLNSNHSEERFSTSKVSKPKLYSKSSNIKANVIASTDANNNQNISTSPSIHSNSYVESSFNSTQTHATSLPSSNSFTNGPISNSNYPFKDPNTGKKNTSKFPFLNKILNKS